MKGTHLGEFEELVLLIIGTLQDDAYSISIQKELKERTGRSPSIGAMHSALNRLQNKGFINSYEGGATKERGGRRKRFFVLTISGKSTLEEIMNLKLQLYKKVPNFSLKLVPM